MIANAITRKVPTMAAAVGLSLAGFSLPAQDVASIRVEPGGAIDSPSKALDEVQRLRTSGEVDKGSRIVVCFACGTYVVERPLKISAAHGPLLLKGAGPLGTVISGGKKLGTFRCELDGLTWRNQIDWNLSIDQLFINNRRADLSPAVNRFAPRAPGAWYLDTTTHEIVYVARKGEHPLTTKTICGRVNTVLLLDGASDITIDGIAFMHNAQGRKGASGAIVASDGSKRISFANCKFEHCANYGLNISGSADVGIRHSWFEDAGGAVKAENSERTVFDDNIVVNCGNTDDGLAVVALDDDSDGKILHNDFLCTRGICIRRQHTVLSDKNRFWKVPGEKDSPRNDATGVRGEDQCWRARVELLTFR